MLLVRSVNDMIYIFVVADLLYTIKTKFSVTNCDLLQS